MRDACCPICRLATESVPRLRFNKKMQLPTDVDIRHCGRDNFLFVANGRQSDYDQYYKAVANDTYHQEISAGTGRSPISQVQSDHLVATLDGFLATPRKVLDFGCGGASLLIELATKFPSSAFFGFDPGPAAQIAFDTTKMHGPHNLSIGDLKESARCGPYDLVIASHVLEHSLDLGLVHLLGSLLFEGGVLYVEVPDSLHYEAHERREFLYYFDRLHVNHFTPQSLARLVTGYGLSYSKHFEYTFPYRDDGEYPALGMLFRKGGEPAEIVSPNILDGVNRYIRREKERARVFADLVDAFEGVLVWGAGDNFLRSVENGGPCPACATWSCWTGGSMRLWPETGRTKPGTRK